MRKVTRPERLAGFDKRLDDVSQDLPRPSIQVCNHGGRNLVTGGGRINAPYRAKAGRRAAGRIACARHDKETAPCRHRSEEHTSELQSLMRISYAVFCLKKKIQ